MPIKVLDSQTVSLIAAGEVVERPASVVKELVENALDAGATQITVEARGGGVSLIRVVDNGAGIPAAEVALAFERHATSKITSASDLESAVTLGFRGEALPSIAAVAQMEMVTATTDSAGGVYLSLDDGVVVNRGQQGRSPGTTVTVKDLFRKLPARLKFLKSSATENSHIANVVSQYALAFPGVKFSLTLDGRNTLHTAGSGRLIDSVTEIYGLEVARQMLPVESDDWANGAQPAPPQVTGLVGAPAASRASREYLSFFINHRWVSNRLLAWAVEEAYHGLLMTGRHPVAVINVALTPSEVDVNIHPAKLEVKFRNERAVFTSVQKAVRQALLRQMPVPMIEEVAVAYGAPPVPREGQRADTGATLFTVPSPHHAPAVSAEQTPATSLPVLRVLGQFLSSYVVAEGPDGLYLIDQHAAHERIFFEKITAQRSRQAVEVQGLLEPVTLEISPRQEAVLKQLANLTDFGFSIEAFGECAYLVRAIPLVLHDKDWASVLREMLDNLAEGSLSNWPERVAISLACHSAVRAGQVLTADEMRELVRQLEQTAVPNTCPHGRPTIIRLSAARLRQEFGRV